MTALATVAVTWTAPFSTSAAAGALGCGSGAQRLRRLRVRGLPVGRRLERGARDGRRDSGRRPCRRATPRRGSASAARAPARRARRCGSRPASRRCRTPRRWSTRRSRGRSSEPVFIPLLQNVQVGERHRLAVLEMNRRPGVWRVWVDGKPMTDPIVLPGSHRIWKPIATAESWNGGVQTCNGFGFRFDRVGVARSLGGSWRTFSPGLHLRGPRLRRPAAPPRPARPADARVRPGARLRVRRRLDRGLAPPGQPATIFTGVPTRTSLRSARTSLLRRRTQPCDTAWPISHGVFVPWTPTTPPPGQSESFE